MRHSSLLKTPLKCHITGRAAELIVATTGTGYSAGNNVLSTRRSTTSLSPGNATTFGDHLTGHWVGQNTDLVASDDNGTKFTRPYLMRYAK
jgi:hypothetical protein